MTAFLGKILGSLMKFVYDMVSTIGVEPENFSYYAMAIIITTIIFKLLLLPISLHQAKSSKKMAEIQPLLKQIQTKYKNDPQTMQIKMQDLYKQHNYNPASGCLILLVQLPIIFAFFAVFREPARYAITTYLQSITMPNMNNVDPQSAATQKTMNYFMPIMIFMAARGFAAGLGLYWVIGNIFTIIQQLISKRSLAKLKEDK